MGAKALSSIWSSFDKCLRVEALKRVLRWSRPIAVSCSRASDAAKASCPSVWKQASRSARTAGSSWNLSLPERSVHQDHVPLSFATTPDDALAAQQVFRRFCLLAVAVLVVTPRSDFFGTGQPVCAVHQAAGRCVGGSFRNAGRIFTAVRWTVPFGSGRQAPRAAP